MTLEVVNPMLITTYDFHFLLYLIGHTLGGNRLAEESYIFLTLGLTPRPSIHRNYYWIGL